MSQVCAGRWSKHVEIWRCVVLAGFNSFVVLRSCLLKANWLPVDQDTNAAFWPLRHLSKSLVEVLFLCIDLPAFAVTEKWVSKYIAPKELIHLISHSTTTQLYDWLLRATYRLEDLYCFCLPSWRRSWLHPKISRCTQPLMKVDVLEPCGWKYGGITPSRKPVQKETTKIIKNPIMIYTNQWSIGQNQLTLESLRIHWLGSRLQKGFKPLQNYPNGHFCCRDSEHQSRIPAAVGTSTLDSTMKLAAWKKNL